MIIFDVVDEAKVVNSVANLNIDVSYLFVHIMDTLIAEITHVVTNDRPPTLKNCKVPQIFQSRPILPL